MKPFSLPVAHLPFFLQAYPEGDEEGRVDRVVAQDKETIRCCHKIISAQGLYCIDG
jgi:hypothetical protein